MKRTILLTGGAGKLGQVLARHFLARGDTVVITTRNIRRAAQLEAEFASTQRFFALEIDLEEAGSAKTVQGRLSGMGLNPYGLINNARNLDHVRLEPDGAVSRSSFQGEFLLDVIVPYELTMTLAGQTGSGLRRVVNVGSQYGLVAANPSLYTDFKIQSPLHYGVCKAALMHLTKELAVRLAPDGVLVNCVAFGGVEGRVDEAFKARYAKLTPLGRMLRESEVAEPVDMLLSESLSAMTGQTLAVDGGWSIW